MPEIVPPPDLVDLKVQFIEADDGYRQICRSFPTGEQIVMLIKDGLTPIADEDAQRSHDAFQRCVNLAKLIQAHSWWRTQPSRADADRALWDAARAQIAAKQPAAVG